MVGDEKIGFEVDGEIESVDLFEVPVADIGQQTVDSGQQTVDSGQQTVDSGQQTVDVTDSTRLERLYSMVDKMEAHIEHLMGDKRASIEPLKQMRVIMQASSELRMLLETITKLENEKMKSGELQNKNEKFVLTELTVYLERPDGSFETVIV